MDCQMPEMDGYEATKEIRKREAATGKHSLIIAMTANALASDRMNCLAVGMDDYISKPINQKKLAEVLQRWLPISNPVINVSDESECSGKDATKTKAMQIEELLNKLAKKGGNELICEFLSNTDSLLKKVKASLAQKDIESLKAVLHQLKGTPISFYASEIGEITKSFEEATQIENCNWDVLEDYLWNLKSAWTRVKTIIKNYQSEVKPEHST